MNTCPGCDIIATMSETQDPKFSELVGEQLASEEEARSLWMPVAQEFDRGGPDASKEYLDAERQRLEEHILNLLDQVEGK